MPQGNGSGRLHHGDTLSCVRHDSFMCATDCCKRIYFVMSGWFSSSSGLFHTRLSQVCVMIVFRTRVSWRMRVRMCISAQFTCVCVYIVSMYTQSRHVRVYIFAYMHTEFACNVYVFAQMHTEFSCGCIREYVSEEFTWVCVYI